MSDFRPSIAVFSGPTATIQNTPPLVTNGALRAQRLARPVTVYVQAFSAHPLERDVESLYAEPDGYVDVNGDLHRERTSADDVAVYEVELRPEDGLHLLPYMARQADGRPWDGAGAAPESGLDQRRQTFYPDPARLFEEIDRFGVDVDGRDRILSRLADFGFVRAAPSGGYTQGLAGQRRTDVEIDDIPPELPGRDFFSYSPPHLATSPSLATLASVTNVVQSTLDSGAYDGAIWLEGSGHIEESLYWLNLLVDTRVPICANASQRPHGSLSNDGDRNIVCSVLYIRSRIWADDVGTDIVGAVLVQDERVFTAREAAKVDARPGGFTATGGQGGIVASIGATDVPTLSFRPVFRHTHRSEVNLRQLPETVPGVRLEGGRAVRTTVRVTGTDGGLVPAAMPMVRISKHARYAIQGADDDLASEVEISARIAHNLGRHPLAGLVVEGSAPYGDGDHVRMAALHRAVLSGMPVVRTGRGNIEGMVPGTPGLFLSGSNLSSTKARLLLMACLLRFGCPPPVSDPDSPTQDELDAIRRHLADMQRVFDTH